VLNAGQIQGEGFIVSGAQPKLEPPPSSLHI
jgi:hypothetical protein